jgi:hypothetical protein
VTASDGGAADAGTVNAPDGGAVTGPDGGIPDAGAAGNADAGSGSGATDAGTPADAGTPPPADGGTGGASACEGIVPATLGTDIVHSTFISGTDNQACGMPAGNGDGFVAYGTTTTSSVSWTLLDPTGGEHGTVGAHNGDLLPAAAGFVLHSGDSSFLLQVTGYDDVGTMLGRSAVNGHALFARNPAGGVFAAGPLTAANVLPDPGTPAVAIMFNDDGTVRYGPVSLGERAVLGVGVDRLGRAVVIFDGADASGNGAFSAIWLDPGGGLLTADFEVLSGAPNNGFTHFETSALAGSGLALSRVEDHVTGVRTSEWVALLPSGAASSEAAPTWLTSRPNTTFELVRGGRAYAFLPRAAALDHCSQQVDLVAVSGDSCGSVSFVVDSAACTSRDLRVGLDGTILQMLPNDREPNECPARCDVVSCTLRFWPAVLH